MSIASLAAASVAVVLVGVIYGTDVFCALVLRPAFANLDDGSLTRATGRIHEYGDQRLPQPGAAGTIATAAAMVCAALAGHQVEAALLGAALVVLLAWLALYLRIAAPINRRMTSAAQADQTLPDIRALEERWESIITARAALQGLALALLVAAIATV